MRYQVNSFDHLRQAISNINDDPSKEWNEYPCLLWDRGKSIGYGSLGTNKMPATYAHVVAYEFTFGPIPEGCRVRHRCGIRLCFRPSHLYAHANFVFFNESIGGITFNPDVPWTEYPCLLWSLGTNGEGYGIVTTPDGRMLAHRLSFMLFHGNLPPGLDICHHCDVRACYHPAHLFSGTRLENVQDMWSKGRQPDIRGEESAVAKLTAEQVIEIRRRWSAGVTQVQIAKDFPVGREQIGYIVRRKSWTHI